MPTKDEARGSGKPWRVVRNVQTGEETVEYLTPAEIAADNARAAAQAAAEASRAPTLEEAILVLLRKEAAFVDGDATVKAYVASLT